MFRKLLVSLMFVALMASTSVSFALSNEYIISIVRIDTYSMMGDDFIYEGSGSGSIISQDGLILTNSHVVMDQSGNEFDIIEICFFVSEFEAPICDELATVIAYDPEADFALLLPVYRWDFDLEEYVEIPEDDDITYSPVTFSTTEYDDNYLPTIGDDITIIGYPYATYSDNISLTSGKVTSFEAPEGLVLNIVTDAIINPGNSGGGAFDENNRFIGIPTEISLEGVGGQYGYIRPVTWINEWLDDLVDEEVLAYNPNMYVYGDEQIELESVLFGEVNKDMHFDNFGNLQEEGKLFTDVSSDDPYYDAIRFLKDNNIIAGYPDGSFQKENNITRAELMKVLVLATDTVITDEEYNNCFPDVKDEWFAKYICYAKEQGWVEGYPDNTFKPGQNVVKVEALKMLLETQNIIISTTTENPFEDVDINAWYGAYIQKAKEMDILEETGLLYHPGDNATRAGVSENIYRLLK